jgi:hypothetical protein
MKLGIVMSKCSPIYQQAAYSFATGLNCDFCLVPEHSINEQFKECDAFILVGNDYKNSPSKRFAYNSGKPLLVINSSFFEGKNPQKYVRVNLNGFVNNMCELPSPDYKRWESLVQYYRYKDIFRKRDGKGILIALNAKTSPALLKFSMEDWLYDTVKQLKQVTDHPIYIRHHRKKKQGYSEKFNQMRREFNVKEESDDKTSDVPKKYAASLAFTTTYSVKSLMYGTSHISGHPGDFVSNIVNSDISEESLNFYPNEDELYAHYGRLSRLEWSIEEIKSGQCWDTLRPTANKKQNYDWFGDNYATV